MTNNVKSVGITVHNAQYLALALMYFAQGIPLGLAFDTLSTLIRHSGYNVAYVGLTGLAFLPWVFKFIWASRVDNACRRWGYQRVIWVTQSLAVLCLLLLAPFAIEQHLYIAIAGIVLLNTCCATQDIATNSYAITHMQGKRAATANALQIGSFILGMLLGGGGILLLYPVLGWMGSMLLLALVFVLIFVPLLLSKRWLESTETHATHSTNNKVVCKMSNVFKHPDVWAAICIAASFKMASAAVGTLAKPWLIDKQFSLEAIGSLQISNMLCTVFGALVLGLPLVKKAGVKTAVVVGALGSFGTLGCAWFLSQNSDLSNVYYYLCFGLEGALDGVFYVAVWAMFMNWASLDNPGTDYTAMQASETLMNIIMAGAATSLAAVIGYQSTFGWIWVFGALSSLCVFYCLPKVRLCSAY